MRGFIAGLGLFGVIAACSSFSADDAAGGGGADAGADGRSDVTGIPHAFDLSLAVDAAVVTGSSVSIPVTITRGGAATGPSTLEVEDLGEGLKADLVTIQESETTVNLVIVAEAGAKQGLRKLKIVGRNAAANDSVPKALDLLVRGPSGTLDLSWGTDGLATLPAWLDVVGMAVTDAGSLTVAGNERSHDDVPQRPIMVRLTSEGKLDPDFNRGSVLVLPGAQSSMSALQLDGTGAGSVIFGGGLAGPTSARFRFDLNGMASAASNDQGTPGLQVLDATRGVDSAAVEATGNIYARSGKVLRRYDAAGRLDAAFGDVTLDRDYPGDLVSGGDSLLVVLSTALSTRVWRVDGRAVTPGAFGANAASTDSQGNLYLMDDARKITRFRTGLSADSTFTSPQLTPPLSTIKGYQLTIVDDELFVHGGTEDNIGGPVDSKSILLRYTTSGKPSDFGGTGAGTSLAGRFGAAKVVKTKRAQLYVAHKATDNSGQRAIARFWD